MIKLRKMWKTQVIVFTPVFKGRNELHFCNLQVEQVRSVRRESFANGKHFSGGLHFSTVHFQLVFCQSPSMRGAFR